MPAELPEVIAPGPRAHLAGTLLLVEAFRDPHPDAAALVALLNRPGVLPTQVDREQHAVKYDCYVARGDSSAWGVTLNDRYEGAQSLGAATRAFIDALDGAYDLAQVTAAQTAFGGATSTVAIGFDSSDRPPRIKVYLQEDRWGEGVTTLRDFAAQTGAACPPWLDPGTEIGVVTVGLTADGRAALKAYIGGPSPIDLTAAGPAEVVALGAAMAESSPMADGWYYLTIRFDGDGWRYAMNKVYNVVQIGWTLDGQRIPAAWVDVASLFERAGQTPELTALRARIDALEGVRVIPTATAIEDGGRSVDVYCAAWTL